MAHFAGSVGEEHSDGVEAQSVEGGFSVDQVLPGQGADGGLFAGGNGFERVAEAEAAAELYFDEDEGIAMAHYEVDLAPARPVVPFDENVALALQMAERYLLA